MTVTVNTATPDATKIAGTKTVADWKALCAKLDTAPTRELWAKAYDEFFLARLESRYFSPIRTLEKNPAHLGEGFAIVAILCSLVEFLESTFQGKTYRYKRKKDPALTEHEYGESGKIFAAFLVNRTPFKSVFDQPLAEDFYANVRCGLLHEARSKGGWLIRTGKDTDPMIDAARKIIFRKSLQKGFDDLLKYYRAQLLTDNALQDAFKRRMNSLCLE
ncbi:hypothetical protein AB3G45_11325 [Shinella sp. S4-D37]|uniref:hypothetical protein n=1 Tax=Shinella sp. S4-D37 TaxID=3161999 RepID=UPI0034650FD4